MPIKNLIPAVLLTLALQAGAKDDVPAPAPIGPLPSSQQVDWQKMETYAFIHFGLNTFNDREWGYGDSDLKTFNPTRLDCEQWARTLAAAGMKGIIITAKHHDGFCLWPTKYTDYCVRNTPYKNGKGDIVGELAAACKKYGLKFGVYLSPWDRHQAFYGTPFYLDYYHAQMHELLTHYGDIFEFWLDGANGGDGWYGGTKEKREIDRRSYYDFPTLHKIVYSMQPRAIIFSDGGPGCRWVGNEKGYAYATNWSFLRSKDVYPGYDKSWELQQGHADGDAWMPAECDVSIRPGWFYHENEDQRVKSVSQLVDIYYRSVGHNGNFLLNVPVDKEGLINPIDSARLLDFHRQITSELKTDLLKGARITASDVRGKAFGTANLTDDDYDSYWATADGTTQADLTITLKKATRLNRLKLQEYIPLGQRVKRFTVEYRQGDMWLPLKLKEEATTIGYCRLLRFPAITTRQLRVRISDARACLCLSRLAAYYAPNALEDLADTPAEELKGLAYTTASATPGALLMDLGESKTVSALFYLPQQGDQRTSLIANYEIMLGDTPQTLHAVATGEFSNIRNNPVRQEVYFTPTDARYVMLKATRMVTDGEPMKYEKVIVK
jgi:alpha-L-fucosidase